MTAARFFAALARLTGDASRTVLAAVCTPRDLDERGRMLGELLLGFDALGLLGG